MESSVKSFILPQKEVKLLLDFLKLNYNPRLTFIHVFALFQLDKKYYVCAMDSHSLVMLNVPNLGIDISLDLSREMTFSASDISGKSDILFEVTEDSISAFEGDRELRRAGVTYPDITYVIRNATKFHKLDEIQLALASDGTFSAYLNGETEYSIELLYLNFLYKNFKNIEFGYTTEKGELSLCEFRNDIFRSFLRPIRGSVPITLGEFNSKAKTRQRLVPALSKIVVEESAVSGTLLHKWTIPYENVSKIKKLYTFFSSKFSNGSNGFRFVQKDKDLYMLVTNGVYSFYCKVNKDNERVEDFNPDLSKILFDIKSLTKRADLEVNLYDNTIDVSVGKSSITNVILPEEIKYNNVFIDWSLTDKYILMLVDGVGVNGLYSSFDEKFFVDATPASILFSSTKDKPLISTNLHKNKFCLTDLNVYAVLENVNIEIRNIYSKEKFLSSKYSNKYKLSQEFLDDIEEPDRKKEYKVTSEIPGAKSLLSGDGVFYIVDKEFSIYQVTNAKSNDFDYEIEGGRTLYGDLVLTFDYNEDLTVQNIAETFPDEDIKKDRSTHSVGNLVKEKRTSLDGVYAYIREKKRSIEYLFEIDGNLYPLWKLYLFSGDSKLGYFYKRDYLVVTDGTIFVFFPEEIPLSKKDIQIGPEDIPSELRVDPRYEKWVKPWSGVSVSRKLIKETERSEVIEDLGVFSKRFSTQEIINWNDEYQQAMEVTEDIGYELIDEFIRSNEIKRIVESIKNKVKDEVEVSANKIDKSIDDRCLDFLVKHIKAESGFRGDRKDLLIIMEACGINKEFIYTAIRDYIRNALFKYL